MSSTAQRDNRQESASEITPLLADSDAVPTSKPANGNVAHLNTATGQSDVSVDSDDQIPTAQVFFLCFARLFEPIAFFSIFPFVNQMVFDTDEVVETDVGFYTGLIESIFSLVQMCFMIPWGRLADHPRVGRKPVLIVSTLGTATCTTLFGRSKNIWQMFVFRCSAGMFAGSLVTIRTMLAENSTPKTQARVFSWFAFTGNLGIFLGPVIGGLLANPAREYPKVFGHVHFFREYPYALSTFVCGSFGIIAAVCTTLFVKETLNKKKKDDISGSDDGRMSMWQLVKSPGVAWVLALNCHAMLLAFSYTAVSPVWYFTSVKKSGLGFTPQQSSMFLGLGGLSQSIFMLIIFPYLQRRTSTGWVIRACAIAFPIWFAALGPLGNTLLRQGWTVAFWIVTPTVLVLGSGVVMSYTGLQLAVNDVNPNPSTLGTLNSLSLALISGIRAFSPALFTSIFAIGVRHQILGGHLAWVVMTLLAVAFAFTSRFLPPNAEGKVVKKSAVDDEA